MGEGEKAVQLQNLPPSQKEETAKQHLLKILDENKRGLTITQISEISNFSRETISKHLKILEYENEIYNKKFGNVQVFYRNHRKFKDKDTIPIHLGNRTIFTNLLENEYGEFIKIAETRKIGDNWVQKGSIMIPFDKTSELIKALEAIEKRTKELTSK